ncbi:MAG: glycogen-binding domain-containing protein [Phycisphaerae bacterium]
MAKQEAGQKAQATTRITCLAPSAHEIVLTGSFNDWDPVALPMTKSADGEWTVDLELPPGRYEYRFVVDGVWCCEPHLRTDRGDCGDCVPIGFGPLNRVLLVR